MVAQKKGLFRSISRILALRTKAQPREKCMMQMVTADGGTRKKVLQWHTVATPEKVPQICNLAASGTTRSTSLVPPYSFGVTRKPET